MPIRQTFPKSDRVTGLSADTPYEGREIVGWPIEVYSGGAVCRSGQHPAGRGRYLTTPTSGHLKSLFLALMANPETSAYRRDLLYRFLNVLKIHIDGEATTLLEAVNLYQREMRHTGRPINHPKLIGTTLLVKGLEYDHAVILDADALDAKELYVAMTRGSRSLTIIGSGRYLPAR